jgi:L-lactate dehydrogenase complex protein LldG
METVSIGSQAMTTMTQRTFLRKLAIALSDVPEALRKGKKAGDASRKERGLKILEHIQHRTTRERLDLLDRMIAEARDVNLNVQTVKNIDSAGAHIQQLVKTRQPEQGMVKEVVAWRHPLIQDLDLEKRFKAISVPLHLTDFTDTAEKAYLRTKIATAFMGITSADFCLADSATMVLKTRPGQARSVSLVPSIHVAIIPLNRILADLNELYALLQYDPEYHNEGLTRCMTFITGPSKTADIEAVMVNGVHGPREVDIYILMDD